MSLIQEALKRKDDENSGVPPKAIPMILPATKELPVKQPEFPAEPPSAPVRGKTTRAWPVLMISLLAITVLALVAVGFLLTRPSLLQSGQQAKADNAAIESPAPPAVVPEPARPAPVLKPVEPVADAAPAAAATVAPMVFSISTGIVKEGTMEKKTVPAEVSIVPVPPPASSRSSWPMLKVVGVMARATVRDGAAIIDGNLVECGDEIRGVKVQGVDKSGVWFEFKSQTQFVRVGQTTL